MYYSIIKINLRKEAFIMYYMNNQVTKPHILYKIIVYYFCVSLYVCAYVHVSA